MKVTLNDGAPRSKGVACVNISKNGNTLEIDAVHGTGEAPPIVLEFYENKLTLRVFEDPKSTNPTYKTEIPCVIAMPPATSPSAASPAPAAPAKADPAPSDEHAVAEPSDDDMVAAFDAS